MHSKDINMNAFWGQRQAIHLPVEVRWAQEQASVSQDTATTQDTT